MTAAVSPLLAQLAFRYCDNCHDPKRRGEERVYFCFHLHLTAHHQTKPRQELKAGTEKETTDERISLVFSPGLAQDVLLDNLGLPGQVWHPSQQARPSPDIHQKSGKGCPGMPADLAEGAAL